MNIMHRKLSVEVQFIFGYILNSCMPSNSAPKPSENAAIGRKNMMSSACV
jgi:hypothetical protein